DFNFYDAFKKYLYGIVNPVYAGYHLERDPNTDAFILLPNPVNINGRRADNYNVGLFDDTVYKYIVHLKTLCAWAEKRDYQVHPSYKTWEIIKREYPVISLTLDELQRIEALDSLPIHLQVA